MNTPVYDLNVIQQCVNSVGTFVSTAPEYVTFTADAISHGYIHQIITSADGSTIEYWIKTGVSTFQNGSAQTAPVVSVLTGGAGAYTLSALGVLATTTVGAVAGAICSALGVGLGVGLYNLAPEFWTKVSRALVPWAYPDASVSIGLRPQSSYNAYRINIIVDTNGNTYIPEKAVEAVGNVLVEEGLYPESAYPQTIPETSNVRKKYINITDKVIKGTMSERGYQCARNLYNYYQSQIGANDIVTFEEEYNQSRNWNYIRMRHITNGVNKYWKTGATSSGQDYKRYNIECYDSEEATQRTVLSYKVYKGSYKSDESEQYELELTGTAERYDIYRGTRTVSNNTINYSDSLYETSGGAEIPGVELEEGATYLVPGSTVPLTYPEWDADKITGPAPRYTESPEPYYPIEIPELNPEIYGNPAEQVETQNPTPTDYTIPKIQIKINELQDPNEVPTTQTEPKPKPDPDRTKTDKDTGTSSFPVPVLGYAEANGTGLVKIYNPSVGTLSALSQWLWSDSFIDSIKKLMQNPMEAIIGLHIVYCTPNTLGTSTIRAGFLDSNISCGYVSQYTSLSCGSVSVPEHFGNALDYSPYTKAYIYLPFIGIKGLRADDIVGGSVAVDYGIDVLTGDCLANITVTRNNVSQILYTFEGNCAIQLPITGGSFASLTSSLITGAASIVGTALTGGNVVGSVVGAAANAVANAKADISKSGSLAGNSGVFGPRTPYIIVSRSVVSQIDAQGQFYGYPANEHISLGDCIGYTRVKDVHIEGITATSSEIEMIDQILKEGFIV